MNKKQMLVAIGLLALSGASGAAAAASSQKLASNPFQRCEAIKGSRLKQADCACDTALRDGTARVLQAFIINYAKEAPSTACGALGLTLLISPGGGKPNPGGGQSYN